MEHLLSKVLVNKGEEPVRYRLPQDAVIVRAQLAPIQTKLDRTKRAIRKPKPAAFRQVHVEQGEAVVSVIIVYASLLSWIDAK